MGPASLMQKARNYIAHLGTKLPPQHAASKTGCCPNRSESSNANSVHTHDCLGIAVQLETAKVKGANTGGSKEGTNILSGCY